MSADGTIPTDWDRLASGGDELPPEPMAPGPEPAVPDRSLLLAAVWGDLVALLVVTVAALVAVRLAGYATGLAALPWAFGVALAWWLAVSVTLLTVRRGMPGMIAMGLTFATPVPARRVPWVLLVAVLEGLLLGLPVLAGPRGWPRVRVAGRPVVVSEMLQAGAP